MTPAEQTEQARRELDRALDLARRRRERLAGAIVRERLQDVRDPELEGNEYEVSVKTKNASGASDLVLFDDLAEEIVELQGKVHAHVKSGHFTRMWPAMRAMLALEEARQELDSE